MLASGMPSGFSREEILAVAALANLELDPAEVELFAEQLGAILAYAEEVRLADTTGVAPTTAVFPPQTADRADEVRPSLEVGAALANAPDATCPPDVDRVGGFFKVPRIIG